MSHAASEWMPWYIDDFWRSEHVAEMNDTEVLLYRWAIEQQWQAGSLPADPAKIKRLAPARFALTFDAAWPTVRPRFETGTDGRLRNQRCADELARVNARVEKLRNAGKLGGKASAKAVALAKAADSKGLLNGCSTKCSSDAGSNRQAIEIEKEIEKEKRDSASLAEPPHGKAGTHAPSAAEDAWQAAWSACRASGEAYELTKADCIALDKLAAKHGLEKLRAKADALLSDPEEWTVRNASPALLCKRWSALGAGPPQSHGTSAAELAWKSVLKAIAHWAQRADAPDMPKFGDARAGPALTAIGGFRQFLGGIESKDVDFARRRFLKAYAEARPVAAQAAGGGT